MKNQNQKGPVDSAASHIDAFRRASANVTKDQGRRSNVARSSDKRDSSDEKSAERS
jgi:hypothetical protein